MLQQKGMISSAYSQKFSQEKQQLIEFMGGKVLRTPTEDGMKGAIAKQFKFEMNWVRLGLQINSLTRITRCAYQTAGHEIWEQTEGKVTHVPWAGTGGTFSGLANT